MKNKISLIFVVAIITSCLGIFAFPARSSAIIADYEEAVTKQMAEADAQVIGKVLNTKYSASEDRRYQSIDYTVEVTKVVKGSKDFRVGSVISMSHDCNAYSEMFFITEKSECLEYAPKVGTTVGIYMDIDEKQCVVAPCPQYRQALIYEDEITDISFGNNYSNNLFENIKLFIIDNSNEIVISVIAIGFGIFGFLQIKKNGLRKSKNKKPNAR